MADDQQKLKFKCPHCECGLSVRADRAGRRGKCPCCQETVTVPAAPAPSGAIPTEGGQATSPDSGPAELTLIPPVLNGALLDLSRTETPEPEPGQGRETDEQLRCLEGRYRLRDEEEPPERRLPWIIDIFLYPMNAAGLTVLLICVGIPFILRVLLKFAMIMCIYVPVLLIFWVLFIVVHWAALALLLTYINWYVCECIRDSARGSIRAADTTAATPGLGDLIAQAFQVIVCLLFCLAPALIYLVKTRQADATMWTLYAVGGFLFPMALLAVVMFESLRAMSPVLVVPSIFSTFFQYVVLVPVFYTGGALLIGAFALILHPVLWHLSYVLQFAAYCLLLTLAHLLGRFYWKYEERLNWEA
jgi:hypothetical protein